MIDLHSHILPGIDDGAPDMERSVAMARVAVTAGIHTIAATPHVNFSYPLVDAELIGQRVGALNLELTRAKIPLAVLPGAEIAISRLTDMDDATLGGLCLGHSSCVLVESPYSHAVAFIDDVLFDLQVRGFQPLLAHPERAPIFQDDPDHVARLVERGVLCSINAGSMAGLFGSKARRLATHLLRAELVHVVASDAHDDKRRAPELQSGFRQLESRLPGISSQAGWLTEAAPAAILDGAALPPRPPGTTRRAPWWRRVIRAG